MMGDILVSLVVIAVTSVILVLIFLLVGRARSQKIAKLSQMAVERGWKFSQIKERLIGGYQLQSDRWTYSAQSESIGVESDSGSSNIRLTTRWTTNHLAPLSGFTMMGPRQDVSAAGAFGEMLLQKAFTTYMGEDAARYGSIKEFKGEYEHLLTRWMIWTSDPSEVDRILQPELVRTMEKWTGKKVPVIKLSSDGIRFEFAGEKIEKPEEIAAMIGLGEVFLRSMDKI
jgi:hypothetical protein